MREIDSRITWPGWETVRLIGRGSTGSVYEIRRDVLGMTERAALKVISIPQNDSDILEMKSDGYDDESITRFFQEHLKNIVSEYNTMRRLNSCPYVVSCDDVRYVQHDDGFGWIIFIKMELLTPLPEALPRDIPEEQVLKIGRDLSTALVHCGQFDIVHRDIKPQNIFLSSRGDCKLGDFGIAKTIERTTRGTKIGTYKYMAPEVYNNQPYGARADIYSLGLVLYWLLNERRLPFLPLPPTTPTALQEDTARDIRLRGEPLPPPAHGSPELQRIVLRACAYDPEDRYASAEELLWELRKLGEPGTTWTEFADTLLQRPEPGAAAQETSAIPPYVLEQMSRPIPRSETTVAIYDRPDGRGRTSLADEDTVRPRPRRRANKLPVSAFVIGALSMAVLVCLVLLLRSYGGGGDRTDPTPAAVPTPETVIVVLTPAPAAETTARPAAETTARPAAETTARPTAQPTAAPESGYTRESVLRGAENAAADKSLKYQLRSDKKDGQKSTELQVPETDAFFAEPLTRYIKASKDGSDILIMPAPESGHGNLGKIRDGTRVTILAEKNGFYFFVAEDGRAGWNGKKFFTR